MKNSSSLNFFGILRCAKLMKCKALWVKVPNLYYLAIFLQISFMLMSNPLKTWPVKAMKTATLILPNHWAIFSTSSVAFLPRSRLKANICSNVMRPKMQLLFKVCILLLFWVFGLFWGIFWQYFQPYQWPFFQDQGWRPIFAQTWCCQKCSFCSRCVLLNIKSKRCKNDWTPSRFCKTFVCPNARTSIKKSLPNATVPPYGG